MGLSDKISLGRTVRKRVNRRAVKQRVWELGGPAPCLGSCGGEEREGQVACRVQQEGAVMLHDASQGPKVCCALYLDIDTCWKIRVSIQIKCS